MFLERGLDPVENVERMVLLRPGGLSHQSNAQGPAVARTSTDGTSGRG